MNGYKTWSLQIPKKIIREEDTQTEGPTANKHLVCIPYIPGLSEQIQRVFKSHSVPSYHKPFNTIKSLLVSPKEKQCVVLYSVKYCECDQEYIGDTARMLGTRFQEHTDGKLPNSTIVEHTLSTGHRYTLDNTKILIRDKKWLPRKIKEALHIHTRYPALNRDRGHKIPPILLPTPVT